LTFINLKKNKITVHFKKATFPI